MNPRALRLPLGMAVLVLVATAVALGATPSATKRSDVQFFCDFESRPSDCGFFVQEKVPGRAALVPVARTGARAVLLMTEPGDDNLHGSGDWERTDLSLTPEQTDCQEGREAWWAHSVLFPDEYVPPLPRGGGVVMDFHHTGGRGQANFHLDAMPDDLGLRLRGYGGREVDDGRYEVVLGKVKRNVWYDFVYHVKWSSGPDGFMVAWLNGRKVLAHSGPTLYRGMGCYLKLANYHSPFGSPSAVIHDRVVRGTSAQAVSLTPLEGVK